MTATENKTYGDVLKAAREEKNISIVQVSETLKLSIDKIESIEASDSDALPAAAFTCGYLRLFARLVDVDESQVLSLYNRCATETAEDAMPGTTSDIPTQLSSNDPGIRIISYTLALVAIALVVLWYQNSKTSVPETKVEAQIETVVSEIVADDVDETKNVVEVQQVVESVIETKIQEAVEPEQSSPEPEQAEQQAVTENIVADELSEENVMATDDEQKEKNIALANKASPVAASGTDVVELTAKEDCWVEVTDANDHLLYFSLMKKGQVTQLTGQQPFSMFLGKATAIGLTLNEIEYDISKHIRSNQVARFVMSMDQLLERRVKQDVINSNSDNNAQ